MPAKRLSPNIHTENIKPVRMWRDDISEMVRVLQEAVGGERLSIRSGDYELDEIDELAQIPKVEVPFITVTGKTSSLLELKLQERGSYIAVIDPDLKMRGAITELLKIANRCKRATLLNTFASKWFGPALFAISFGGLFALRAINDSNGQSNPPIFDISSLISMAIGAILFAILLFGFRAGQSIFYTKTRSEQPTFWMRKKDDLLLPFSPTSFHLLLEASSVTG